MNKQLILFVGPPGAGKGALSKLCIQEFQWAQLSTGNLCRYHIAQQTDIGKEIAFAIKSGSLVSDSLITDMVKKWLFEKMDSVASVILDGYPRAIAQAQAFNEIIRNSFPHVVTRVVHFSISDAVVMARLSGRVICKNSECQAVYSVLDGSILSPKQTMMCDSCASPLILRDDDQAAAVVERLAIYHCYAGELIDFYHGAGQPVTSIDAERPLHKVFEDFKKLLNLNVL